MLLWMSSGRSKIFFWRGGRNQGAVDLPQDVALEAANDLWFGQPLLGAPLGVGLGGEVVAQPAQHDPVQRTVGGAVAAAVEPVAINAAAAGRQGCDSAQVREGGLAVQPVWVVPGGDQQLPGDVGADAQQRDQTGARPR